VDAGASLAVRIAVDDGSSGISACSQAGKRQSDSQNDSYKSFGESHFVQSPFLKNTG
jgi:hypothetical protein